MAARRLILLGLLLLVATLAATSCGTKDAATQQLQAMVSYTDDDIIHFLRRTQFGARTGDIERVRDARMDPFTIRLNSQAHGASGLPAFVDQILTYPRPVVFGPGDPVFENALLRQITDATFPSESEMARWSVDMMVHTDNPFQELLALFWHDLFATSTEVLTDGDRMHWFFDHYNLWRRYGSGNLRDLLFRMSTDWAMIRWLDGYNSTANAPNENFAREFFELFTLGVDNGYTQNDIVEASRAFTGFRIRTVPGGQAYVEYDPARHDTTDKTIFGRVLKGRSGPDSYLEYLDMVNLTLANRGVAEFICKRLYEFFVHTNPSQAIVDHLAETLRQSDYELKAVLRVLLTSNAFYGATAKAGLVKSPAEYIVGFIRSTGLEIPFTTLDSRLLDSGQRPTQPPTVNGWPTEYLWLTGQGMLERTNLVRECITDRNYQNPRGITVEAILPAPSQRSAANVVNTFIRLLGITPSATERQRYVDYLNTDMNGSSIVFADPFDGNNATQIDKKVRGLLYIMAQHPTYHVR
ncbi:MAG: DUF1800 family protein [Planctomycetota bacterium]